MGELAPGPREHRNIVDMARSIFFENIGSIFQILSGYLRVDRSSSVRADDIVVLGYFSIPTSIQWRDNHEETLDPRPLPFLKIEPSNCSSLIM